MYRRMGVGMYVIWLTRLFPLLINQPAYVHHDVIQCQDISL